MNESKILSYTTNREFTGNNAEITKQYKALLVNNNMINADEDLILVSEEQLKKHGGKIKENTMPISLNCPPDENHKSFYTQFFYPITQIEHFNEPIQENSNETKDELEEIENVENDVKENEDDFTDEDISYNNVLIPKFAIMTDKGFKSYTDCIIEQYDKQKREYTIRTGQDEVLKIPKKTVDSLYKNEQLQQQRVEEEKKEDVAVATGIGVVFQDLEHGIEGTKLPDFSLIDEQRSGGVLKTFSNFKVQGYNQDNGTYVVSNGDTDVVLKKEELSEIINSDRLKMNEPNSPKYEKLLQTQYEDYFKPRNNTATNFIHNMEVYCRKEACSPLDSVRIAKELISKMPKKEQKKTKSLLNESKGKNQSITEALVDVYNKAVKVVPLNEQYIEKTYPDKFIPRSFYDTISAKGELIGNFEDLRKKNKLDPSKNEDRNLKIGDTLRNIKVPVAKAIGKGKESVFFEELTVVSASKDKNCITFKNKDKSLIEVPRDKFLEIHREVTKKEIKKELKTEAKSHKPRKDFSIEM